MSTSFCSLSRRIYVSIGRNSSRFPLHGNTPNKRLISHLSYLHSNNTTHSNHYSLRHSFSTDNSGKSNNTPNIADLNIPHLPNLPNLPNLNPNTSNNRIYNEAKNQKSLVRATGKNKSLVPYIGSVLIVPVQKPLFPGFSSMLYLKDENLKIHFLKQFRKRIQTQYNKDNHIENAKDIINSTEWIGLFLAKPKNTPITAEEELNRTEASPNTPSANPLIDELEDHKIVWHPALDEVNSDMHHFVESLPSSTEDIFQYGVLAKIDYNDETTNIAEFVKLENTALAVSAQESGVPLSNASQTIIDIINDMERLKDAANKKSKSTAPRSKSKGIPFPVTRWEDPLVLKVISARRIKLDSIAEHQPLLTGNIQHLQPSIQIKKPDLTDPETLTAVSVPTVEELELQRDIEDIQVLNDNKHIVNESESEIKCRSAFNVASDLLRRLYADDPDQRRDMIQLWSARHHIDIGFFCDFAASITNSTPRELQKLLECVDYGERLELLCKLLKREEFMMKKRDEIMNNVDALIKKEDESNYLRMVLHTTQRRLMVNHRERNILTYGAATAGGQRERLSNAQSYVEGGGHGHGPQQAAEEQEEKKDRYQRLAIKFKERVEGKEMCAEAKEIFDEGIEKLLNAKNKESLDVETTKQYLDWMSSLPWNYYSIDNDNISAARDILDEDHYGMKLVKERILEVIACNILRGELNLNEMENTVDMDANGSGNVNGSKILCLVGPPGVGKTSIGSSIARALNRRFFKFSLGGSDDSHLLKGFLRTYAGSQPGKIIYGLKQCGTANPMILIDEIDKMGARHSDPSHALLEILDPAQNQIFSDNYLDFPVDLSKILFVCTANDESKINPILKDRLHVIQLNGYDEHEKLEIARKYLIPNALKKCGLKKENISFGSNDEVIVELIKWYSRESGVRSLAQNIEKICYKSTLQLAEAGITFKDINNRPEPPQEKEKESAAEQQVEDDSHGTQGTHSKILEKFSSFVRRIASDPETKEHTEIDNEIADGGDHEHEIPFIAINCENLKEYVGLRKYQNERTYCDEKGVPFGVVTGLAYTTNGGCITYVETIKYKKNGDGGAVIKATGQLGKVMAESVEIAQCVARALLSNKIDDENRFFDEYNVHLHCPEGGIAKDGPSAGITMVTALLSLALNQKISPNIAMTGEVTLTGKILKIGGLKEKLLAAKRSKINTLILPFDNFEDFYDDESGYGIPKYLRDEFKDVHFVKNYDEVLQILFTEHLPPINSYGDSDTFRQIDLNESPEMPKPL